MRRSNRSSRIFARSDRRRQSNDELSLPPPVRMNAMLARQHVHRSIIAAVMLASACTTEALAQPSPTDTTVSTVTVRAPTPDATIEVPSDGAADGHWASAWPEVLQRCRRPRHAELRGRPLWSRRSVQGGVGNADERWIWSGGPGPAADVQAEARDGPARPHRRSNNARGGVRALRGPTTARCLSSPTIPDRCRPAAEPACLDWAVQARPTG